MYPYDIIVGLDLYDIMLCLAILAAMAIFRLGADRIKLKASLLNFTIFTGCIAIVCGYFSAVLFQAFYNIQKYGEFRLNAQTGATFYGGLIGGALIFLLVYFGVGFLRFRKDKEHIACFWRISDVACASIAAAHGLGRIGCLMAGCCHGAITDRWYGIYMVSEQAKVVPIQLYEAIFLFALSAWFLYRVWQGKGYNLCLYMVVYGVWRFVIEYARDDYRGNTFVSFLTPSQLTAVMMIVGGVALLVLRRTCRFSKEKS